ncbi:bis(5'-nucleosyl)-tetraphosphatase [Mycoplasma phocoenae]|uniref:Bis(5'-nucleosyl)-tetraphosphatase [asymmetrical] n=1 Tax=Mycoplasma phocoenae TaxID=754517 RepID=A0A858U394_9MOLU|nr:NUDIX domain-containing protein [Mycoplasma phocoenae]QJG66892.1 NUDIX domain-containing protein [Mycoplasma phocoenae]
MPKTVKSCGGIIFDQNNEMKVLIVKHKEGHWGFPKGRVEGDETELETARRELREETNLEVGFFKKGRLTSEYYLPDGKFKTVVYFPGFYLAGELKYQRSELTDAKWILPQDVNKYLTQSDSEELIYKALNFLILLEAKLAQKNKNDITEYDLDIDLPAYQDYSSSELFEQLVTEQNEEEYN